MNTPKEMAQMTESDLRRFAAKVALPDDQGCMIWLASKLPTGYGRFSTGGRKGRGVYAHRISYQHFVGQIPRDMEIDHVCHVRSCVAPEHLRAVTKGQNNQNRSGAQSHSKSGIRGVYWSKEDRRWRAGAKLNGRGQHIGSFLTKEEAEAAAVAWRSEHMPHSVLDALTVVRYSGHGLSHGSYRADVTR